MKLTIFNLIFTVFLFWLTIQISAEYEEYLSYFFILTVGIIHGSNDISLINIVKGDGFLSKRYLWYYIGLILINIAAFIISPRVALICFIIISCYHFGEQHLHSLVKVIDRKARFLFLSYGSLIFGLLFHFNIQSTSDIINGLIDFRIPEAYFTWFLVLSISLTLSSLLMNRLNFKSEFNYFKELFLILLFAILFKLAALLWAFAIYFIVWHSLPSLQDQIKQLYGDLNKFNVLRYIKSSFPYWLISLVGLALLYVATSYFEINFITIFFAFLAAITVPHVIVMYILNRKA